MTKNQLKSTTSLDIHSKINLIQAQIKELVRTEENKFQKYFFFNECQVLQLLKPLLEKYHLTLLISDDISQPFLHEKDGKEHYVKYLKKLEIVDAENPEQKLLFHFWAGGQNTDLAKAKGSAETYAIKYFLTKFFLIPAKDEGDPDYGKSEKDKTNFSETKWQKNTEKSLNEVTQQNDLINSDLVDDLIRLFRQKTTGDKEKQTFFLTELDKQLTKQGVEGTTDPSNFRIRLTCLTPINYQWLYNWLLKIEEIK
jgi:hypothetical protein